MKRQVLGIDVSKKKFDVALLIGEKYKCKFFKNNEGGFRALIRWLAERGGGEARVCMEATGVYGEELACYLCDAGFYVSVVNPAQVKGYALSELSRTKTDKADAKLIARFCLAMQPQSWHPRPAHIRELREWVRRQDALQDMLQQESNRLDVASEAIGEVIYENIVSLKKQIQAVRLKIRKLIENYSDLREKHELLNSIPGVGDATIIQILAFIETDSFSSARQLAAFLGLNPKEKQSGSSVRSKSRISKTGNSRLRKAFYFPALVAMKHNPTIITFSKRLANRGKSKMTVIGAVMRKLVHLIYGVLKSKKTFQIDPPALNCA